MIWIAVDAHRVDQFGKNYRPQGWKRAQFVPN
jgi:hypothetical protein